MTFIVDKVLEDAVSQAVKKLVQTVGDNVELIGSIDSEMQGLSDDIETFNARLDDAFKNPKAKELQLLEVVLRKFQIVVNHAQDAVVNYTNLMKKHEHNLFKKGWDHIPLPLCGKVKDCAREIKLIRARMKTIRQDHEKDLRSLTNYVDNDDLSRNQVGLAVEEDCFVGFKDDLSKINNWLKKPDSFDVMSIVGVPGSGKTTFAKKVLKMQKDNNEFIRCIRVHVSQGCNRKQKFIEILNQIDNATENFSIFPEEVLEQKINVSLGDKKYFIVMDDVWEKKDWDCLQGAFPRSKGSKVLVTTRNQSVADCIGEWHCLQELEREKSWELLETIVFGKKGGCSNDSLETHGNTIAGKCEGLPLAIVVIGGILRKCRTVADWRRVAENPSLEINRKDQIYHKIVMLSCNHFPHEKLKNCFLYFASFPKGYQIPARKLIHMWIAEEFILTKDDQWGYSFDVEAEAWRYLADLVDRNLVKVLKTSADGQIKTCIILDSLHEFCKIEAAKKNLFHVLDGRSKLDLNTISPRRLCCTSKEAISGILDAEHGNDAAAHLVAFFHRYIKKKSPYPYGPHVHSLLLSCLHKSENPWTAEQLATIPNNFPLLRVLDIESHNFSSPSGEFYGLEHLKYLAIKTDLNHLPKAFKKFRALETLVFITTESKVEIRKGIWDMEMLRHVCTNTSAHLPSPPKKSKSSSDIRTLSTISPISCTEEIFSRTPKLQKLGVRGNLAELLEENNNGICLFNHLQKLSCLENLKLHHQFEKVPMPNNFPITLRKLTLSNTLFDWNDISKLATLVDLEVLKLDDNAFKGEVWALDKKVVFKQLQYLRIRRSNLVTWKAEEINFPTLKTLLVRNCTFLEEIPIDIAKKKGLKVQELIDESEKDDANSAMQDGPVVEDDCFVGFDNDLEIIKALIKASDNFSVISIVGMPGTGKSSFAKKVLEDLRSEFKHCIWIHVSQVVKRKQKFIRILDEVTGKPPESSLSLENLEKEVKDSLKDKYLVVMDDLWEEKDWDCLKTALPKSEGSRVLATTRNQKVADSIGDISHSLPALSPSDSWLLLEKKVFGKERCPDTLRAIGEKIATKCNGLPLAIVTIAGILSVSKTPDDWNRVAENPFLEINRKDQVYSKKVMLSCNNLAHENLRNCFLYFASFPMGHGIPAHKLIHLWIAEGFIPNQEGDVEVEGQKYLKYLVDRNLVKVLKRSADGEIKMCSIHDSLHEFCKIEAAKKNLFHVMDGRHELDVNTISPRRLCYHFITNTTFDHDAQHKASPPMLILMRYIKWKSPIISYGKHVHSLLLSSSQSTSQSQWKQEQLATIPKDFPLLRVLDIESHNFNSPSKDFYGLEHLKYLAIKTDLLRLPKAFNNFRALETLVFTATIENRTVEIPKGIWDMHKLRHVLCTNATAHLPSPPKKSKSSSDIRTLSKISPESCTEVIFNKTPKLQKLGVRGNLAELLEENNGICLFHNLGKLSCLEKLKLHHQSNNVLKAPIPKKFPVRLRNLTLSNTSFKWSDISILQSLEELEVLKLEENAFTGERWDLSHNVVFNGLQYLSIRKTNLVTWTATKKSFPVLESLVVRNCTHLEGIPYAFAEVDSLKVVELLNVNKRTIDSTEGVNERRRGKENIKEFKLITPPKATEHKQTLNEEENVNASQFDLPTTTVPSQTMENKQTHEEENVNVSGFNLPTTSILSQAIVPMEEEYVVGFDDEVKTIKDGVKGGSKDLTFICIEGMIGIGKTTLTKMVFMDNKDEFEFSTEVHVSRTFEGKQIFLDILSKFPENTEDVQKLSEKELGEKINQLLKDEKYLIVMDDVWREDDWNRLKIAFPNNKKGSRVLVTTRHRNVASCVDSNPHHLKSLSNVESWRLLEKKVFGNARSCPPSLEAFGRSIAIKCRGLPLAVVLIAHILKSKTPVEWKQVADGDPFRVLNERSEKYKEAVKLSYDDLPSKDLKSCFLYLAAFPIGHEIAVWKLIRLWIAEGFINSGGGGGGYAPNLETIAEKYLKNLVDRNLLMVLKRRADGQIKTCCMQDQFYEFCRSELFDETPVSRICIHSPSSVLDMLKSERNPSDDQHVRSFLSFCSVETMIPDDLFTVITKSFPHLKVMDVESFKFKSLGEEFYQLSQVSYLAVSTHHKLLPKSFEDCSKNMQTLVFNTSEKSLQVEADIWSMSKLRHVHSNTCMQLPPPSKILASTGIHTLSTISPSSCTRGILEKTPNLQKLGIRGNLAELMESKGGIRMFDNLQILDHLDNLKLLNEAIHTQAARLPRVPGHDKFPPSLRKLTLSNTWFPWSDMYMLGKLEQLEVLKLDEYAFTGEYWELDEDIVFKNLRFLRIGRTDLVSWTISESCFPMLETLLIRNCTALDEVPSYFARVHTLNMLELFLTNKMAANSARQIHMQKHKLGCAHFQLSIYPPDR